MSNDPWWMDTDELESALDRCDLGDGYKATIRTYPHKDMLNVLTKVMTVSEHERLMAAKDYLIDKLTQEIKELGCSTLPITLVKRDWTPK